MSQYFTGLDDLRAQLEANGWRIYPKHLGSDGNACNWIACMKGPEDAPDCECTDKPPQFVVTPYHIKFEGHESQSALVDMTGVAGGQWFKLQVYSITASELLDCLPEAKARLAAAWSAIGKA